MSAKFPVGAAANETVQFAIAHWSTVLRYAWLPFLFAIILIGGFFGLLFEQAAFQQSSSETMTLGDFVAMMRFSPTVAVAGFIVVMVGATFLMAGVMASIFEFVVTGRNRSGFFHFRIDGPAIRAFLALIIVYGVGLVVTLIAAQASLIVAGQSIGAVWNALSAIAEWTMTAEPGTPPPAHLTEEAGIVGGFFALTVLFASIPYTYLSLKLSPLPAGSTIENRLIPFKAFAMTRGHVWSILGAAMLLGVFFIILQMIFGLATGILELATEYFIGQGAAIIGGAIGLIVLVASIIFQAFVLAAQGAFQGIIYRRLETGE